MALVVSDTSPLRALNYVGLLDLLPEMFGRIIIPTSVDAELQHPRGTSPPLNLQGRKGFEILPPKDAARVNQLLSTLDLGEAEAIVMAEELNAELLLIDERAGYAVAQARHIPAIGVLGLLARAKAEGRIPNVRSHLDQLQQGLGFWISPALRERILRSVQEKP